jgi:hypothetical protein
MPLLPILETAKSVNSGPASAPAVPPGCDEPEQAFRLIAAE